MIVIGGHRMSPEQNFLYDKSQLSYELTVAIIEFLISESANPEETKKKLEKMVLKHVSSHARGHAGKDLINLLK
ncbi:hypothetical protein KKJ06_21610 [Xenorhabdus bovienii]|uniref:Uncharacterized protein n=4 Tax=Xenorhabdus TaxID=626 RepID=A0A2D0KEN0_9GAMM|nr:MULTISPECIES: hypothetical protein [Xenorhabdus]MDE9456147.1 hypothetical protein [Xenorhabdus bovienii]MDE9484164.1 hypothetical protein [Xenorhabdus bovienii]MDE9545649.1 hypothetical protein [Xenorhabdus bovienii]MDE9553645.1 hypothetical protein [Xenorhabdus bovienii]MDE9557907.1 hypothetical protein [Xenorhabdus bovienii]